MNQKYHVHQYCAASLLILSLALSVGCSKQQSAPPTATTTEVGIEIIQPQSLQMEHTLAGRTTAYMTAEVRPQVSGLIEKRLFREGDQVKAGQALYQLDAKLYQAAVENAQGTLANAEATLLAAQPKAKRYQNLLKLEAVSQQDAADAQATLKQGEATVKSAHAALNTAKINLGYTTIRAPISGRIATSTYTPGALVTAEQTTALTTIQQLDPIYVDISLSSTELLHLRKQVDQGILTASHGKVAVNIILEDGSIYEQKGSLEFIGTSVDTSTNTVKLRVLVPNPKGLLLPGTYVKAQLPLAVNQQAILIPQKAVTRNHKGEPVVKLLNTAGKVEERTIVTSDSKDHQWVVTSGLSAGDKLIVEGASTVSAGEQVKATLKTTQTSKTTAQP